MLDKGEEYLGRIRARNRLGTVRTGPAYRRVICIARPGVEGVTPQSAREPVVVRIAHQRVVATAAIGIHYSLGGDIDGLARGAG